MLVGGSGWLVANMSFKITSSKPFAKLMISNQRTKVGRVAKNVQINLIKLNLNYF